MTTPATSADIAALQKVLHNDAYAYSRDMLAAVNGMRDAILAALKAAPASTAAPAAGPSTPAASDDPTKPSPENTSSARLGDQIVGAKTVTDDSGTIYSLLSPVPAGTYGLAIGSTVLKQSPGDVGDGSIVDQLLKRSGKVYGRWRAGFWKYNEPSMGFGFYNAIPPGAVTPATIAAAAAASVPQDIPLPARNPIAPGSNGNVVRVSPGQLAAVVPTLKDGDTLMLAPGSYNERIPIFNASVLVTGDPTQPKPHLSGAGLTDQLAYHKGLLVGATDLLVDWLIISDVAMDEAGHGSTACIRPNDGCPYIGVRRVECYNSQFAVAGGGFPCHFDIGDGHDFHDCGHDDGSHCMYISAGGTVLDLYDGTVHSPNTAHAVKSRADVTRLKNEVVSSATGSCLNVPDGSKGASSADGVTFVKPPGSGDHKVLTVGDESGKNGTTPFTVTNSVFDCQCDNPFIKTDFGSSVVLGAGVTFKGTKPTAQGTVSGL